MMIVPVEDSPGREGSSKRKPKLVDQQAVVHAHRILKDKEYASVHEENQTLRLQLSDLNNTLQLVRAENKRLNAQLLEKGRDMQHLKDYVDSHRAQFSDESSKHKYAQNREREETMGAMKQDIAEARASQQNALEELDHCLEDMRRLESELKEERDGNKHDQFVKELEAAHEKETSEAKNAVSDLERELKVAKEQVERKEKEFERLELSTRQGQREVENARERIDAAEKKAADAEAEMVRANSNAKVADREAKMERDKAAIMERDVKRLETMVAEIDTLRNEIDHYRDAKELQEDQDRRNRQALEKKVAELRHEKRALTEELETLKDDILTKEREAKKATKEQEIAKKEAEEATHRAEEVRHRHTEVASALKGALQDRARLDSDVAKLEQKLARHEARTEEQQTKVQKADESALEFKLKIAELTRMHDDERRMRTALEQERSDAASRIHELTNSNQLLHNTVGELSEQLHVVTEQANLLREMQEEQNSATWHMKYEELEREMQTSIAQLHQQSVDAQRTQDAEVVKLQREVDGLKRDAEDDDKESLALRNRIAQMEMAQTQLTAQHQATAQALEQKEEDRKRALRDQSDKFDTERKKLQSKLAMSEAQRKDLETSLDAKIKAIQSENAKRKQSSSGFEGEMGKLKSDMKAAEKKANETQKRLTQELDEEQARVLELEEDLEECAQRIAELEMENEKLREVQLNW